MGSESSLWNTLRKNMKGKWKAQRIENMCGSGVPDVYATIRDTMVWIELKHAHKWPIRESTVLKIEHYTADQKRWIKRHGEAGANVFLFLQVKRDYLLFNWRQAQKVGALSREDLIGISYRYWKNRIDYREFVNSIIGYDHI